MSETYVAIGEVARASGLTVSALRFYDKEGVFVPAVVDGATGYRRYATAQVRVARLLAGMRRVGVPLAEITVALEQLSDTELVQGILAGHLHRLEDGLADAARSPGSTHSWPASRRRGSAWRWPAPTSPRRSAPSGSRWAPTRTTPP